MGLRSVKALLALRGIAFAGAAAACLAAPAAQAQGTDCDQPDPVCDARAAVFAISAFDPVGSAVRVGPDRLVTARHVVADQPEATLFLADGTPLTATVVPSGYAADLVFLTVDGLPQGPALEPAEARAGVDLFTIGADVGRQRIRAYDPGQTQALPAAGHPLARLHHDAYSQPGNSGGALVDAEGRLVGIVASGGEGRFEAIPSSALAVLESKSGPAFAEASAELGAAVRICTTLIEERQARLGRLQDQEAKAIATSCGRAGNRQLLDLAGQTLGRGGAAAMAVPLFERALAEDPNAVNTRLGLVVTHHLLRDYEAELPHLHWLMEYAGEDLQVLRFAIQAGTWGGDPDLAAEALARLKRVNPQTAPAAERFMAQPPPRPPKLAN
ncbi:trypsin-like peptidase domain-containing protein [Pelagibius sp.]|uniref:trypsin-like peptidase domain-containing protein n=1 Tax=Pelagibius sp. TaxID=1931238 RepID=UPI0026151002|nr:trypsin-like peptidase domain-containing protein [Pelagibius sp.]